jgi:hypothetical protein
MSESDLPRRPGGLTTLCIAALVLALFALLGAATAASGGNIEPSMFFSLGQPDAVVRVQQAMQAELREIVRPWLTWFYLVAILNLGVAGVLCAGGVLGLKMRRPANILLLVGFIAGLISEAVGVVPGFAVQKESVAILERYVPLLVEASLQGTQQPVAGLQDMTASMTKMSSIVGLLMTALISLAKVGFYVFGIIYLRRPMIRSLFAERAAVNEP